MLKEQQITYILSQRKSSANNAVLATNHSYAYTVVPIVVKIPKRLDHYSHMKRL